MSEACPISAGRCYYRKTGQTVSVRRVDRIDGPDVFYSVLAGPQLKRRRHNRTTLPRFARWVMGEIDERTDYHDLDGGTPFGTVLVRSTTGAVLLRCDAPKARFYLRKGYAVEVEPGVLQFTSDVTEKRLAALYGDTLGGFFLAVKNARCVVCGTAHRLTRHHVVPRRVLGAVPRPARRCLSNVLFVCLECHARYERTPEPDLQVGTAPLAFCRAWQAHFLRVMDPKYLPAGWDLVSVPPPNPA